MLFRGILHKRSEGRENLQLPWTAAKMSDHEREGSTVGYFIDYKESMEGTEGEKKCECRVHSAVVLA